MMTYPQFDPVIVKIGPIAVRWYGMMYLLGFFAAYGIIRKLGRFRGVLLSAEELSDLLFYGVLGVILGGRLGYTLFYNFTYYSKNPLRIFAVWEGGMSFHGGLIGVVVAVLIFMYRRGLPKLLLGDVIAPASTVGLCLGRVGNFINGELWGRVTDVPWGMVFPGAGPDPRHPSQLYEAFLEGPLLFLILMGLHRFKVRPGVPLFSFFFFYGVFRFVVEFFRQPDEHIGFLWGGATMGQVLCVPMILAGIVGVAFLVFRGEKA